MDIGGKVNMVVMIESLIGIPALYSAGGYATGAGKGYMGSEKTGYPY